MVVSSFTWPLSQVSTTSIDDLTSNSNPPTTIIIRNQMNPSRSPTTIRTRLRLEQNQIGWIGLDSSVRWALGLKMNLLQPKRPVWLIPNMSGIEQLSSNLSDWKPSIRAKITSIRWSWRIDPSNHPTIRRRPKFVDHPTCHWWSDRVYDCPSRISDTFFALLVCVRFVVCVFPAPIKGLTRNAEWEKATAQLLRDQRVSVAHKKTG